MKKSTKTAIVIAVVLAVLCAVAIVNFDSVMWDITHPNDKAGYYYDIDDLREKIDKDNKKSATNPTYYENCDYLFSKDFGDIIVDFVISGDRMAIVRIGCSEEKETRKYGWLSYESMRSVTSGVKSDEEPNWRVVLPGLASSADSTRVKWCVVSETSKFYDESYGSFKFSYGGETFYIMYGILDE